MKRSKFTEEQIIGILREQEAGAKTAELCRRHGISSATFYAWKAAAKGVVVTKREALEIGVGALCADDDGENLKLAQVGALLNTSRLAQIGLYIVAAGTTLQLVPCVLRLAQPLLLLM